MTKTPVTYKETLLGVLTVHEIERMILDNLIRTQKFLFRNFSSLSISEETAKQLHHLLAGSLFVEAGTYRKHNVQLGEFMPPSYVRLSQEMKNWEADFEERKKHAKSIQEKLELCAWTMHRFLWIHPFFDYNGRISRLLGQLFLLQHSLPLTTFQKIARVNFVSAMKHATATGEIRPLVLLLSGKLKK